MDAASAATPKPDIPTTPADNTSAHAVTAQTPPLPAPIASPLQVPQFALPESSEWLTTWPKSAQMTLCILLVFAVGMLAGHVLSTQRWTTRPTELSSNPVYRIELNTASRAELMQLPGIGDKMAARILQYRQRHGAFQSFEDLGQVSGFGLVRLERLRSWIWVDKELLPNAKNTEQISRQTRGKTKSKELRGKATRNKKFQRTGKKLLPKGKIINVNDASAEELQQLPRIGSVRAQLIIEARKERPFQNLQDLRRVPGIGPKTLEGLKPHITWSVKKQQMANAR